MRGLSEKEGDEKDEDRGCQDEEVREKKRGNRIWVYRNVGKHAALPVPVHHRERKRWNLED